MVHLEASRFSLESVTSMNCTPSMSFVILFVVLVAFLLATVVFNKGFAVPFQREHVFVLVDGIIPIKFMDSNNLYDKCFPNISIFLWLCFYDLISIKYT